MRQAARLSTQIGKASLSSAELERRSQANFIYHNMIKRFLRFILKTKNYARLSGVIFFAIGLFGFAFRSGSSLPDKYLILFLILGFWGVLSGFWDRGQ